MRFNFLSAVCLIGYVIFVSADLSVLQNPIQDEGFAHHDLEQAFRKMDRVAYNEAYSTTDDVVWYHRQLVEAVRCGAGNIRCGPSVTMLELTSVGGITDVVIGLLQSNMNSFIVNKALIASTGKAREIYTTLQDSAEAHTEYADGFTGKMPIY